MTPGTGIVELLAALGVGNIAPHATWPIYESQFPTDDNVARCIVVREVGGRSPEVKLAIDYPSVQVLVRGGAQDYMATRAKIEEVFLALQAVPSGPVAYPELTSCVTRGGRTFVGYDEVNRPVWSLNFDLIESKAPEGNRDL